MDIALVLDISGSVDDMYRMTRSVARQIVFGVNMQYDRARIATVAYATDIVDSFYLNTYEDRESVISAMNYYRNRGETNTQEALKFVRQRVFSSENGDRSGVRDVAIVVSDGDSNIDDRNTIPEAERLKDRGVTVYSVALGDNPNRREMDGIASDPKSEYAYAVEDAGQLESVISELLDQLCEDG